MRKYKEKILWRNIAYSYLSIAILVFLILYISRGVFKIYQKYTNTKEALASVVNDKIEVDNKLTKTQNKLDNINTEEGRDKFIRDTYNLEKNGEGVIIVYDTPSSTYNIPKDKNIWEKLKDLITNLWR